MPDRPGLNGSGTVVAQVPVAALTENFSARPLIAPPGLGSDTEGSRSVARAGCPVLAGS
jgi:hypothetical protein